SAVSAQAMAVGFVDRAAGEVIYVLCNGTERKRKKKHSTAGPEEEKEMEPPTFKRLTLKLDEGLPSLVVQSGERLNLASESATHPRFHPAFDEALGVRSASTLCLPLKSATTGATFGV